MHVDIVTLAGHLGKQENRFGHGTSFDTAQWHETVKRSTDAPVHPRPFGERV